MRVMRRSGVAGHHRRDLGRRFQSFQVPGEVLTSISRRLECTSSVPRGVSVAESSGARGQDGFAPVLQVADEAHQLPPKVVSSIRAVGAWPGIPARAGGCGHRGPPSGEGWRGPQGFVGGFRGMVVLSWLRWRSGWPTSGSGAGAQGWWWRACGGAGGLPAVAVRPSRRPAPDRRDAGSGQRLVGSPGGEVRGCDRSRGRSFISYWRAASDLGRQRQCSTREPLPRPRSRPRASRRRPLKGSNLRDRSPRRASTSARPCPSVLPGTSGPVRRAARRPAVLPGRGATRRAASAPLRGPTRSAVPGSAVHVQVG